MSKPSKNDTPAHKMTTVMISLPINDSSTMPTASILLPFESTISPSPSDLIFDGSTARSVGPDGSLYGSPGSDCSCRAAKASFLFACDFEQQPTPTQKRGRPCSLSQSIRYFGMIAVFRFSLRAERAPLR